MPFSPDRKYQYLTDAQAQYLADLVGVRFAPEDEAGRQPWRDRFAAIRTHADVSSMIEDLKAIPTMAHRDLAAKETARREAEAQRQAERRALQDARPTEEGLYRNPETGELYRLKRNKDGELIVSKYSLTGGPRRLTADLTKIEKGSWKRYTGFTLGYGPDCAEKYGLPWGEEVARRVLAARQEAN